MMRRLLSLASIALIGSCQPVPAKINPIQDELSAVKALMNAAAKAVEHEEKWRTTTVDNKKLKERIA